MIAPHDSRVLQLWMQGKNTYEISKRIGLSEASVERVLNFILDMNHRAATEVSA